MLPTGEPMIITDVLLHPDERDGRTVCESKSRRAALHISGGDGSRIVKPTDMLTRAESYPPPILLRLLIFRCFNLAPDQFVLE